MYGANHFVAASSQTGLLSFFDFRMSRPYNHTDGLPCSAQMPAQIDPRWASEPYCLKDKEAGGVCKPTLGQRCVWHDLSTQRRSRPDFNLHSPRPRVYNLAKSWDGARSFYTGANGGYVMFSLGDHSTLEADSWEEAGLNNVWKSSHRPTEMMEFGHGLMARKSQPLGWVPPTRLRPSRPNVESTEHLRIDAGYELKDTASQRQRMW